jgi:hypothetical protein
MAFLYIELFRKGSENTLVGHIVRVFNDGVTPPIPQDNSRMARLEVTNRDASQVRAFLDQGVGRIKIANLSSAIRTSLRATRDFSGPASAYAGCLSVDRDPAAIPAGTRKMRVRMDLPNKPNGAWFTKAPGESVYTCMTDPNTWFDAGMVEAAAALVPIPLEAAQGLIFEEIP